MNPSLLLYSSLHASALFGAVRVTNLSLGPLLVDGEHFAAHVRADLVIPGRAEPLPTEALHLVRACVVG